MDTEMNSSPKAALLFRLDVGILVGVLLGAGYAAIDVYLEHHIGVPLARPDSPIEVVHSLIDFVLPIVCGGLFGVALHYLWLRQRIAELERQRADELSRRLGKIERNQAVWVLSASLLHELKTPLHALGLLLDELLELPEPMSEEQKTLLDRARAQTERLGQKVQTLRAVPSFRKLEEPSLRLGTTVRELAKPLMDEALGRSCDLEVSGEDPAVRAQPAYLKIIVENLVDNSLDALERCGGGTVSLRIQTQGSHAVVTVSDNGPGLSEPARRDLFEPLATRKTGGLGLGLSTSRQLARAMGGELAFLETAAGACFQLTLPLESSLAGGPDV